MSRSPLRRLGAVAAIATLSVALPSGPAFADAAGPTDYETTIESVTPDVPSAVRFSIEGSDAFVRAVVAPGHELVVLGYDGEDYIRIDADGTVSENHNSETYYYNRERFGGDVPAAADSTAAPDWVIVDDDGEHAWHDHRAHWMAESPLVGMAPGDSFPPERIDVIVDGTPVTITVVTTLRSRASAWWLLAGVAAALPLVALAVMRRTAAWPIGIVIGAVGSAFGIAEYVAVPPSTGPSVVWWALPVVATATFAAAGVIRSSVQPSLILTAAGGVELVIWAVQRSGGLLDAYRPTVLPIGADRIATIAVGLVGVTLTCVALAALIRAERTPESAR